jgi:hypothetical protein
MEVASRHTYAASPDAVFAAMTSPAVLTEKYTALGHRDIEIVGNDEGGGTLRVTSRRGVPLDVPGFAKRFLSPVTKVEQVDEWRPASPSGERRGTWKVSAAGVPVSTGGTLRLRPTADGGTLVEIKGEVTCSVPLIGGKIASFVGADVERTIHAEEAFNDDYLATHPGTKRRSSAGKRAR